MQNAFLHVSLKMLYAGECYSVRNTFTPLETIGFGTRKMTFRALTLPFLGSPQHRAAENSPSKVQSFSSLVWGESQPTPQE
mmetsp:Transcript_5006/g.6385  ORF Transcript_5006/g.6385 Transcript_5006/m.6385 type:complete len:81 (-) Transcript_5006:105-347(-)